MLHGQPSSKDSAYLEETENGIKNKLSIVVTVIVVNSLQPVWIVQVLFVVLEFAANRSSNNEDAEVLLLITILPE